MSIHKAFTRVGHTALMQRTHWGWLVGVLAAIVLIVGGFYTYLYLKEKPPAWLIEALTHTSAPPALPDGVGAPLQAPEGFTATIFSRDVPGARVMTFDPNGTMLVSETGSGRVVALTDKDKDGTADEPALVLADLKQPHGLSVQCIASTTGCTLYVAETGSLKSYSYDPATMRATDPKELQKFPTGDGHFTRTILPTENGKGIYISIGSDCNVCDEMNKLRATIQYLDLATNSMTTFATGLRNSVFMAYDSVTGKLWATDNGRDVISDDVPPDDVNIIEKGNNYGWPICYGNNVHDTDFDKRQYFADPCRNDIPSHIELQAHSAALGLAFIPAQGWPVDMQNDLLVAYHGS